MFYDARIRSRLLSMLRDEIEKNERKKIYKKKKAKRERERRRGREIGRCVCYCFRKILSSVVVKITKYDLRKLYKIKFTI